MEKEKTNNTEIKIFYIGNDSQILEFLKQNNYEIIQIKKITDLFKLKETPEIIILDSRIKFYKSIPIYFNSIKKHNTTFICLIYENSMNKKTELLSHGIEDIYIIPDELKQLKLKFPQYITKIKERLQYKNIISQLDVMNSSLQILLNSIEDDFSLMESIINIFVSGFISSFKNSFLNLPEYLLLGRRTNLKKEGVIFHLYEIEEDGFPKLKQVFFKQYNDIMIDLYYFQESTIIYTKNIKKIKKSLVFQTIQDKIKKIKDILYFHDKDIFLASFNNQMNNELVKFTFHTFAIQIKLLNLIEINMKDLKTSYTYTINTLARAAEASDELTGDHISRVGYYSIFTASKMGLSQSFKESLFNGAKLHDIGKIHIPETILKKRGPLTEEEWAIMKQHTIFGAYIIGESDFLKTGRLIALQHHENYDGSGYPYGLDKNNISLEARIVKLADVYDSLRSPRPYKKEFSHQKTLKIILEGDQRIKREHFDPDVLKIFEKYHKHFDKLYEALKF